MGAARSQSSKPPASSSASAPTVSRQQLHRRRDLQFATRIHEVNNCGPWILPNVEGRVKHLVLLFDGPQGCGKTAIVKRCLGMENPLISEPTKVIAESYKNSSGMTVSRDVANYIRKAMPNEGLPPRPECLSNLGGVYLVDTADYNYYNSMGQGSTRYHEYYRMEREYPSNFYVAVLVFDVSSRASWDKLKDIVEGMRNGSERICAVIGNKSDLGVQVPLEEVQKFIDDSLCGVPYFVHSATIEGPTSHEILRKIIHSFYGYCATITLPH